MSFGWTTTTLLDKEAHRATHYGVSNAPSILMEVMYMCHLHTHFNCEVKQHIELHTIVFQYLDRLILHAFEVCACIKPLCHLLGQLHTFIVR